MVINGITVCVGYAPLLRLGLGNWLRHRRMSFLTVVTTPDDQATIDLVRTCDPLQVTLHTTNVFTANGAMFNKGAALAEAHERCIEWIPSEYRANGWLLLFDADINPGFDWHEQLLRADPQPGNLYGAKRYNAGTMLPEADQDMAGYFHLSCLDDPNNRVRPFVDTHWVHAGNYDTNYQDRWPKSRRVILPLSLVHYGQVGVNWCGMGQNKLVAELHRERQRRGGEWRHETILSEGK